MSLVNVVFLYINYLVFSAFLKCWRHLGRERNAINYPIKQYLQILLDSGSCHIVWCFQKHASIHITVNCLLSSGITAEKNLKYYLRYSDLHLFEFKNWCGTLKEYPQMKITGHSSPMMLKKYIKADQLEVVSKIQIF